MAEYPSREYCKDTECEIQQKMDSTANAREYNTLKAVCVMTCKAYMFHQWLQDHDYRIVKEE